MTRCHWRMLRDISLLCMQRYDEMLNFAHACLVVSIFFVCLSSNEMSLSIDLYLDFSLRTTYESIQKLWRDVCSDLYISQFMISFFDFYLHAQILLRCLQRSIRFAIYDRCLHARIANSCSMFGKSSRLLIRSHMFWDVFIKMLDQMRFTS